MKTEDRLEGQINFADETGLFYEDLGFPRVWGRVLGWLLVCEPDYQSAESLATALHASRGSISTTTRSLVRAALVERYTIRGDRRTYYRIRAGAWMSVLEDQVQTAKKMRELAERGLELLASEPAERRRRLEEMHDLTAFYEREAPVLLAQWQREHPHQEP